MKKNILMGVILALIIGLILGRWTTHITNTQTQAKKPLYWIDTMEPKVHYPNPGNSRMGMKLIPVFSDEEQDSDQSTIRISPTVINNLGIRTATVRRGTLARCIDTVGYVEVNGNNFSHIHTYADGWVRKLFVKAVGDPVRQNQVILQLYSPQLVNVQDEFLIALESRNQALINASYKKLQAFHISEQQIQQLKATRKSSQLIDIYPHQNGIITELMTQEGMRVTPDTEMVKIVDLSSIWIIAQVLEVEANWIKVGDVAEARITAFPGKVWKGTVEYIYPLLDSKTRTVKIRLLFPNPDYTLKPNMYSTISLRVTPKQNVLSIPLEALIRSSEGDRVIVALGNGRFQARRVVIGMESGERVEILSGLKSGEKIIISGQFLLDSESNLKAGLERMQ